MRRRTAILVAGLAALGLAAATLATGPAPYAPAPVTPAERAEAEAYLAASLPPMPEGVTFSTYERAPGVSLETAMLRTPGARGTVVISPGWTAPLELYAPEFGAFAAAGFNVAALSPRGQGRSWRPLANPEKAYLEDYAPLAADLAGFVEVARAELGGPILVYGNSMGGHVALRMAGDIGPDARAYGLLVPMAKIRTAPFPYGVAKAIARTASALGAARSYAPTQGDWAYDRVDMAAPDDCSASPAHAHQRHALFALDPALRVDDATNGWIAATMASTEAALAPGYLARIEAPVLAITAGDDRIVDSAATAAMCAALPDCEERRLPKARHCVMQEGPAQRDEALAEMVAFFAREVAE